MTMLEKIARAMCVEGGYDPDDTMPNDGPRWRYYEPLARAGLTAILEPSEGVILAALNASEDYFIGDEITAKGFRIGLKAMIRAALEEEK